MGKAARWLRGLLGGKKQGSGAPPPDPRPVKEKKRWGFVRSYRDKESVQQKQREEEEAVVVHVRKGSYKEGARSYSSSVAVDGEEQNKHAIAVAAATAAVAEAAVAAAQAAAAVVRLTSSGRCAAGYGGGKREEWAAVEIQAAFRGYLARRALRALKGLVKLQALVRGNIVRKQAAETLRCMHALVRVQARARSCRALVSERGNSSKSSRPHPGPPTPEKYEPAVRSNRPKHDRPNTVKRTSSKPSSVDAVDPEKMHSSGWNWLDRWMEERYGDSREATSRTVGAVMDDEKNEKILEIDTGKSHFNSKRRNNHLHSSASPLTSDQNSRSFATVPDSPSKDSTIAHLSNPSPSSVHMPHPLSPSRLHTEVADLAESPQFYSASSRPGSSRRGPFTPAKSECSRSFFSGYSDYPSYMANTESSRAKVRSQSAPKQRPELEKSGSIKRLSVHGLGAGSALQHSSSTQRSSSSLHAKFTSKAYPGSGRLDRLGMPIRI